MRRIRVILTLAALLGFGVSLWSQAACAGEWYKPFRILAQPVEAAHREKPQTCRDPAIEQLADEIDWLEHHIDAYGSVVAKTPDVWGETRLMRHRWEYERQMAAMLTQFEVKMQASLARSDQAFLGMAMALQSAASGKVLELPTTSFNIVSTQVSNFTAGNDTIQRTLPFALSGNANGFSFSGGNTLSLEPTTQLNQLSRYLNHLHELRRINEGDDTSDSPGYSLNLVRIPVSVLPGKKTREGYGAEITLIATPVLGRELLPTTFRNLVINDLVDLIAPVVTELANDQDFRDSVDVQQEREAQGNVNRDEAVVYPQRGPEKAASPFKRQLRALGPEEQRKMINNMTKIRANAVLARRPSSPTGHRRARMPLAPSQVVDVLENARVVQLTSDAYCRLKDHPANAPMIHYMDVRGYLNAELQAAYDSLTTPDRVNCWSCWNLSELAHRILRGEKTHSTWNEFKKVCEPLATAGLPACPEVLPPPSGTTGQFAGTQAGASESVTDILCWAVLVESALLNEQLKRDMKELASAKGIGGLAPEGLEFFGPEPTDQAREAFNEYVRCRWPIRVFALDPVTDEQNVADAFARRRELQVAMAVAFASGRISAQGLMRFSRRLEWDMATIDLNRTVVGFAHGEDTFGWRFYPRFQTPPIKGNLATFWETTFGGPTRDQDIRQRQLEPGMRECVAIVVMPSFLPYITLDTRTNWFKLTNPKCTEISMQETMRLSRAVKAMQCSAAACAGCAHLYRDGEVQRLLRRVAQLDRELPLQTLPVQVPYENTLGGFAMFNHGVTDLGPELIGWYGAPGIDPVGQTSLFLVGDRFSVLDTQLIAGGRPADFHLISRQVMQVTVPPGPQALASGDDLVVDFHLATPYGVSSHLLIPVAPKAATLTGGGFAWLPGQRIHFWYKKDADPAVKVHDYAEPRPTHLAIAVPRTCGLATATNVRVFLFDKDTKVYLGAVEQSFAFDPQASVLYASGTDLDALVTGIQGELQKYLAYKQGQTGLQQPVNVVATAELAPAGTPPIPVAGSVTIPLKESP